MNVVRSQVEREIANAQRHYRFLWVTAPEGAHAGQQFLHCKRLRQIITRSFTSPRAVSISTRLARCCARTCRKASNPSIPGKMISSTIKSNGVSGVLSKAASLSWTTIGSCPASMSADAIYRAKPTSSSTTSSPPPPKTRHHPPHASSKDQRNETGQKCGRDW